MGLAASQARLLLLTARKSDLEYRAQQITNSEMILAMQTEQVAREYSTKISDQPLYHIDALSTDQATVQVSAQWLKDQGYKVMLLEGNDPENGFYEWSSTYTNNTEMVHKGLNGEASIPDSVYNTLSEEEKKKYDATPVEVTRTDRRSDNLTGYQILEAYNRGTLKIYTADGQDIDLNGNNSFTQSYYTDNDREAEAEYERKTASIQVKEKRLQNDLNQVETQQKACDTEIDSVKKVMEKNIERTFKVFS